MKRSPATGRRYDAVLLVKLLRRYTPAFYRRLPAWARRLARESVTYDTRRLKNVLTRALRELPRHRVVPDSGLLPAVAGLLVVVIIGMMTLVFAPDSIAAQIAASGLLTLLFAPAVVLWTAFETRDGLGSFFRSRQPGTEILAGVAAGVVIGTVPALVLAESSGQPPGGVFFWIYLLTALTVGPLLEEIIFRRLLLREAGRKIGNGAALILTSVVFSLGHLWSADFHGTGVVMPDNPLTAFLVYFFCGLGLGGLFLRWGKLTAPLTAHMTANAFNILLLVLFAPS